MQWSNNRHLWGLFLIWITPWLFVRNLAETLYYSLASIGGFEIMSYFSAVGPTDWISAILGIVAAALAGWSGYLLITNYSYASTWVRGTAAFFIAINVVQFIDAIQNIMDVMASSTGRGLYTACVLIALQAFNIAFWILITRLFKSNASSAEATLIS